MSIHIIENRISHAELKTIAKESFEVLVKGVVDVEKGVLALGGELHADANAALLRRGSEQKHLWGFNLYPDKRLEERTEYIALINIRPASGNRSMEIKDAGVRNRIKEIVDKLIS